MEAKSLTPEELQTLLYNSMEGFSKQLDKLQESLKKTNEALALNTTASKELNVTVAATNDVFEKVSQGIKDLYAKVQGFELISKLMGSLGGKK